MRRRRTVYIAGQRWKVEWDARIPGAYGICDYETRTIKLAAGMDTAELVDTILHELIHARWPDLDETAVADMSETCSQFLDAAGLLKDDWPHERRPNGRRSDHGYGETACANAPRRPGADAGAALG